MNAKRWVHVVLRGLGQIAFADRPLPGVLVLAAIAVIAPWSAVGALTGAVAGALVGLHLQRRDELEWQAGLSAYNPAILGLFWGGLLVSEDGHLALALLALVTVLAIDRPLSRLAERLGLAPLSVAPILVVYLVAAVFIPFEESFWDYPAQALFGVWGYVVGLALLGAALFLTSPAAALQTAALTGGAALLSGWWIGDGGVGPVGLWGFAVAPAAFGVHGVFLAGSAGGARAGLLAALVSALVWLLWVESPLVDVAPPLLVPFYLGTWLTLFVYRRWHGAVVVDPSTWTAVSEIRKARALGKPVVALTGAGVGTASGIPDYVSGAWQNPEVPVTAYSFERFKVSPRCRRAYWIACHHFREVARKARPNPAHKALAALEQEGWLESTITQNVDGLDQAAGAHKVVELHGSIGKVRCIACGWKGGWPPADSWRHNDVLCPECTGLVKPAVIAMGEDLPPQAWAEANRQVSRGGVLMVVGTQMAISSAAALVQTARHHGARVVFINNYAFGTPFQPDDVLLPYLAEEALPAIAYLLDCAPIIRRFSNRAPPARLSPAAKGLKRGAPARAEAPGA